MYLSFMASNTKEVSHANNVKIVEPHLSAGGSSHPYDGVLKDVFVWMPFRNLFCKHRVVFASFEEVKSKK